MQWRSGLVGLSLLSLVLIVTGCSSSAPPAVSSSTQEVQVKGKVTINGAPAKGGEVMFDPANINRPEAKPTTMPIGDDGTYSGTTLVGEVAATVTNPALNTPELTANRKVVTLEPGENTVDIAIP